MIKNNILKIIILIYITVFFIIGYGHFLRYNNYLTGGDSRHVDKNYTEFLIGKYKFENYYFHQGSKTKALMAKKIRINIIIIQNKELAILSLTLLLASSK